MRFERLRARGLGPFKEEIDVDFSAIAGKLVAITGSNGSGKTSLLELLTGGSCYRQCPTRGSLSDLATTRDAYLETVLVNGARHTVKHVVDAHTGKGESVVLDAEGRPVISDAKVRSFDTWAAKHLPAPDVLYASTVAAQAAGGFLEMKAGERKAVLLRALGIEKLEAIAERAREHARETKVAIATLDARIADARGRAGDPVAIAAELDALKAQRVDLEAAMLHARAEHEAALAAEQVAKLARKEADEYLSRRSGIVAKLQRIAVERADIEKRIGNNRGVLERGEAIRKAVARAKDLDAEREARAATVADLRAKLAAAENDLAVANDELASLDEARSRVVQRAARAQAQLADRATVEAAATEIPAMREAVESLLMEVSRIRFEIEETNELRIHGAENRILGLRGPLVEIAGGCSDADARASTALRVDDEVAERLTSAPATLSGLKKLLAETEATLSTKRGHLAAAERTAARAAEIANAAGELDAAKAEATLVAASIKKAEAAHEDATNRLRDLVPALDEAVRQESAVVAERAGLADLLKFAEPLAQAQARLDELSPQYARLDQESKVLTAELEALGDQPEAPPIPDLTGVRIALDSAERAFRGVDAAIAVKEAQLTSAKAAAEQLAALENQRREADADLADWTRLSDDLGRDGIQSLELDAAGPEITAITNDLLHEAFGPRFTVRFDTVRRSSDGKKDIEAFDISVLDTEKAREGTAETYSGGERVILSEAIGLAISTIACRRTGSEGATLIRDESGAALDENNAKAYCAMLRRGAELIGASQVLLVSHSPPVWDLCDARIVVANGKVEVAA